ncbi:MAG: nucleotidyltransferase domain-containing protein [Candidatus Woesearchaeota archaeon]
MESERLSGITKYQTRLKGLLDKNIVDIIIFGSFVKQGSARDIDVAILVRDDKDLTDVKKQIRDILNKEADIQIIGLESIHSPIWLTLIKEGFSVKKKTFLRELYGIKPAVLYKYSLKTLTNVQKVQFERGIKKVLGKEGTIIARSVVLVPLQLKGEMMDFLKNWNIYYTCQEYELLPLLRKEEFL